MSGSFIYTINSDHANRVYVVGDLHGRHSLLMQELKKINFDFHNDWWCIKKYAKKAG